MKCDVSSARTRARVLCARAELANSLALETIVELRRLCDLLVENIGRSRLVTRTIIQATRSDG
jgi:hypothetical protein